jgi:ABC-type sugar transport system substrate-binding protein
VAPGESTPESIIATVKKALDQQPDVVCLFVGDAKLAQASIDLIASRQTLLVTIGERCDDPRVSGHVGVGLADAAEQLGDSLKLVAAGRQSYLLVHESGRNDVATNCYRRFITRAQWQPDLTLLQAENAAAGSRSPAQLVEEMLARFPHAGLVVTLNPDIWLTARAGWNRELHQLNAEFRFATLSAAPVLWHRLGTPEAPGEAAALVGPLDGEIGYAAVEMACQLLVSPERRVTSRVIPCELVTPERLADFARRYAAVANGLDVSPYLPEPVRKPPRGG